MGALLAGIVCLLLAYLVVMPAVLSTILYIVGIVLVLYGIFVLFAGYTRTGPGGRRVRWF